MSCQIAKKKCIEEEVVEEELDTDVEPTEDEAKEEALVQQVQVSLDIVNSKTQDLLLQV